MVESIVLTGGPCGGKSSALPRLKEALEQSGWRVLTVPETATDLIRSGVAPWMFTTPRDFQYINVRYMSQKHASYINAANMFSDGKPTVVIFDRGINDCAAYAGAGVLRELLALNGLTPIAARDSYGAVFHMTTAADGALEHYVTGDNTDRTESGEQAITLDSATLAAWVGHPHLRVIDNSGDFEAKIKRLIAEVEGYLGIPEPLEVERKFLVHMPDLAELDSNPMCQKVDITQVYLNLPNGVNCRIRKRGIDDDCVYIKTEKHTVTDTVRQEIEERITKEEFERLLQFADPNRKPIVKTRRTMVYKGKYFELDNYGFWKDRALLEIEMLDANERFEIPPYIEVVREVTADRRYTNANLAFDVPTEEI